MQLTFTHKKKSISVDYEGGNGHAILYSVPKTYSDDGYCVAVWQDTEIEPAPSCAVGSEKVLCRVRLESGQDGIVLKIVESNEGATCHG